MTTTTTTSTVSARTRIASVVAVTLFLGMAVFQISVAVGLAPINMLWGGSQEVLTPALRLASVVAASLLLGMAYLIYQRANRNIVSKSLRIVSWIITAYMILNTCGNFASSNRYESLLFGPITIALALSCGIVSSSEPNNYQEITSNNYQEITSST